MIINISDVWLDARDEHLAFLDSTIEKGLKTLKNTVLEKRISKFITDNRQIILTGSAGELINTIKNFEALFNLEERVGAVKKLNLIFNYSAFSKKSSKEWNAYKLCEKARHTTCCYCQLVKVETVMPNDDAKGYRPPIDHYYVQSAYPFLSLTLSNFIPCCEKCNGSQMKGTVDFSKERHLNPLVDEESIVFCLEGKDPAETAIAELMTLQLPKDKYSLKLQVTKNQQPSNASIKTFQLVSRYEHYSETALRLARTVREFVDRKVAMDAAFDFNTSFEDILGFERDNYKDSVYGKARLCIAEQFGSDIN